MANGRCYRCGGKSTGAPLKHGRYSKYLPTRLMSRYEEGLSETDPLSLEDELAVGRTFIKENLSALSVTQSAELWEEAKGKYKEAISGGPTAKEAFKDLGRILENGFGEAERIEKHWNYTERLRRIAETEGRRQAAAYLSISLKEMAALQAFILAILRDNIHDPSTFSNVHAALMAGISRRTGGGPSEVKPNRFNE